MPANARDIREASLIPGLGRSPAGGHGNPLQYSCLENPMGRGAWQAKVHRVAKRHDRSNLAHTAEIMILKVWDWWKLQGEDFEEGT